MKIEILTHLGNLDGRKLLGISVSSQIIKNYYNVLSEVETLVEMELVRFSATLEIIFFQIEH